MNKKIIQVVTALFLIISIQGCKNSITEYLNNNLKKEIVEKMEEEIPGEEFYFIHGIDSNWSMSTNIRHRGILYSKRLEELNYPGGLELGLENRKVTGAKIYSWKRYYESIFQIIEIDGMAEKKAKEIFGEKTNLINNGMVTQPKYEGLKKLRGMENVARDEKYAYHNTIVNVFVEDLENLDIEEYKKKTYELSKYIYNYMNYVTSLQIYVRDDSYFENYDLVEASIYKPFRKRKGIKRILGKIKKGGRLDEKEKMELVNSFRKGGLGYKITKVKFLGIRFKNKDEIPILIENIEIENIK